MHYCVEWVDRKSLLESWYYPPMDDAPLRAAVERWAPHVLDLEPEPEADREGDPS